MTKALIVPAKVNKLKALVQVSLRTVMHTTTLLVFSAITLHKPAFVNKSMDTHILYLNFPMLVLKKHVDEQIVGAT